MDQIVQILVVEGLGLLLMATSGVVAIAKLFQRVKDLERAQRVASLEAKVDQLHADHKDLEDKVDANSRLLQRIAGILSIVHPEAADALDG